MSRTPTRAVASHRSPHETADEDKTLLTTPRSTFSPVRPILFLSFSYVSSHMDSISLSSHLPLPLLHLSLAIPFLFFFFFFT